MPDSVPGRLASWLKGLPDRYIPECLTRARYRRSLTCQVREGQISLNVTGLRAFATSQPFRSSKPTCGREAVLPSVSSTATAVLGPQTVQKTRDAELTLPDLTAPHHALSRPSLADLQTMRGWTNDGTAISQSHFTGQSPQAAAHCESISRPAQHDHRGFRVRQPGGLGAMCSLSI
ncbi:uncharacterized protein M421DRAFT_294312 [Didymella exigua CBS 183.55]|uniref:Uncharacterized protein n=1 Tax=Didymella exigua CBS 183.55 TaxID=1150837 RepID=A0A6A5RAB4_9PLEO|nr:uncharacterized protein M421DRAFT_294312 [Didymella exigua CBS 183.55]KAF1924250.1 hypothetical protein M421DRAFT_294312 [Didymella exigua CBS 183.55]